MGRHEKKKPRSDLEKLKTILGILASIAEIVRVIHEILKG